MRLPRCTVDAHSPTRADGCGVVYRQRDRAKMFALLWQRAAPSAPVAETARGRCAGFIATRCRRCPASRSGEMVLLPAANQEPEHG